MHTRKTKKKKKKCKTPRDAPQRNFRTQGHWVKMKLRQKKRMTRKKWKKMLSRQGCEAAAAVAVLYASLKATATQMKTEQEAGAPDLVACWQHVEREMRLFEGGQEMETHGQASWQAEAGGELQE